jgi:hypothetical protein
MKNKTSIVIELQHLASEKAEDISDLLRKALLVATKLRLGDFQKWIKNELNGYEEDQIPSYRRGRGEIKLKNPYHGLVPVAFEDSEIEDMFCDFEIRQSIGSLEAVIASSENTNHLTFPLNTQQTSYLFKQQGIAQLPPVRVVAKSKISSILDIVQNTILEWALKLEDQGILGDGLSFSPAEKERAAGNMEIKIENFQGVFGDIVNSSVTQNLAQEIKKGDISSLNEHLKSLGIKQEEIIELNRAIETDPKPEKPMEFGEKVNGWIGKMISKTLSGTWNIATGAAGGLLATALAKYYGL